MCSRTVLISTLGLLLASCDWFEVLDPDDPPSESTGPVVDSFSPDVVEVGSVVTLRGQRLSGIDVTIGGIEAPVTEARNREVSVIVPALPPGPTDVEVDTTVVGSLTVIRPSEMCPPANPAGGPLQIFGDDLAAAQSIRFTKEGRTIATVDALRHLPDGSLALQVPDGLDTGDYTIEVWGSGLISRQGFEVIDDYPFGPPSPQQIVFPEPFKYIPPLTNYFESVDAEGTPSDERWYYESTGFDPDFRLCQTDAEGPVGFREDPPMYLSLPPGWPEQGFRGEGSFDMVTNQVSLTFERPGGQTETYRGSIGGEGTLDWGCPCFVLYSDRTCRQLVIRFYGDGGCPF